MSGGPINPSFGSLGYWHLVAEYRDDVLQIVADLGDLSLQGPYLKACWIEAACKGNAAALNYCKPIRPVVLKALALELAVHFGQRREPLPDPLVRSLAILLELPDDFLADHVPLLQGDDGSGRPKRQEREIAMWLDLQHLRDTGRRISTNALRKRLAATLGGRGPAHSTIAGWRAEQDWVEFIGLSVLT